MSAIDFRNRSPGLELLPDRRLRVTRIADVLSDIPQSPDGLTHATPTLWYAWGTADPTFSQCRLIKQDIAPQDGPNPDPCIALPKAVFVYEEISATLETPVGSPDVRITQYNLKEVDLHFIQFSSNAATYQTPGTTTAPSPFGSYILREQTDTDDGTLRTIKRTYCELGQLAQYDELKFLGKVLIRTIKTLGTTPSTPSGFTLVTQSIEYIGGLRVFAYGYASAASGAGAGGEISRDIQYNISPDQGTTGVTVTTIERVSDPSVTTNPITGPVGSELIEVKFTDESGYRLWRAVYAQGAGLIKDDKDIREGGKLIVYSRSSINVAPTAPAATIGGTVTLITLNQRNGTDAANGTIIYDSTWAEGIGVVSSETSYDQSIDGGTNGVTRTTIRQLSALSVSSNPIASPGGVLITGSYTEQDGYRLWTAIYARGQGLVLTEVDLRNNGKLVLYHKIGLGSAPTAPASTIGGTVTLVASGTRNADGYQIFDYRWAEGMGEVGRDIAYSQSSDEGTIGVTATKIRYLVAPGGGVQPATLSGSVLVGQDYTEGDGYRIWNTTWARGVGLVVDDKEIQQTDALIVYHRMALGTVPATPSSTIGGTVSLFETNMRQADGYVIYDYRWAEGDGQASIETRALTDGAIVYTVTNFTLAAFTPLYPGGGTAYLVNLDQTPRNGYFRNQAVYHKPPATITLKKVVKFHMPGIASFVSNELLVSPDSIRTIICDQEISYSTSQISTVPFKVDFGAYYRAAFVRTNNNDIGEFKSAALENILSSAVSISGTAGLFNGVLCDSFDASLASSSPPTRPTGSTVIDVDNDIYLVAIDGTVVYRRISVTHSF